MTSAISIVTPSYNQGPFIERTVRSVLSQEVEVLEYLVIDGGSTDQIVSILKRYSDRLYWVSETDHGQPDAINKGISRSTAPIVGWLNSDDFYYPGALQTVLEFFGRHPESQCCMAIASMLTWMIQSSENIPRVHGDVGCWKLEI